VVPHLGDDPARVPEKAPCVKIFQIQKEGKNKRLCFTKSNRK